MDNLTHSLTGALLGQMGLKRKTGLAMPTLIIAANIPDIDAVAVLFGGHQHLAIRRGITHGPIAMLLLPIILWVMMLWFDNWQLRRSKRPESRLPIHKGWLLTLAYIGCLSHPALDWLNSYGIRLLEPFSSNWFYGDSIFIIDIWIWAALIAGVWISLRQERGGRENWKIPAFISFGAILFYILGNISLSRHAVQETKIALRNYVGVHDVAQIVANPVPIFFWKREILFGSPNNYYQFEYSLFDEKKLSENAAALYASSKEIIIARHAPAIVKPDKIRLRDKDADAFLFWSRMPHNAMIIEGGKRYAIFADARFTDPMVSERFRARVQLLPQEENLSAPLAAPKDVRLDKPKDTPEQDKADGR
ncbi:hypothetical protein LPB140_08440 [Sphingorhabdus lutea]|uniref:Metal-dependent hydrolase n=1 Tax=Sphingorhabdus lutea TaxID=1913578 RepID=A0A1L3JCF1_9SPHN|nr:metal-dependent hydrolase [Sphingorhabdus lutea]APG62811.1 hypothetical protein LPB140_08440 [Sphingorhabdus lutea]